MGRASTWDRGKPILPLLNARLAQQAATPSNKRACAVLCWLLLGLVVLVVLVYKVFSSADSAFWRQLVELLPIKLGIASSW